ncbi:AT-rich interactive domain-containing protein 1B, partial [Varanus komodoensis]
MVMPPQYGPQGVTSYCQQPYYNQQPQPQHLPPQAQYLSQAQQRYQTQQRAAGKNAKHGGVVPEAPTETAPHEEVLHLGPCIQKPTPQPSLGMAEQVAAPPPDSLPIEQTPEPSSKQETPEGKDAASSTQEGSEQAAPPPSNAELPEHEAEDAGGVVDFSLATSRGILRRYEQRQALLGQREERRDRLNQSINRSTSFINQKIPQSPQGSIQIHPSPRADHHSGVYTLTEGKASSELKPHKEINLFLPRRENQVQSVTSFMGWANDMLRQPHGHHGSHEVLSCPGQNSLGMEIEVHQDQHPGGLQHQELSQEGYGTRSQPPITQSKPNHEDMNLMQQERPSSLPDIKMKQRLMEQWKIFKVST